MGYTHKGELFPRGRIREATATLTHRGPDQQGVFESAHISLGAVRLKIIDLESGAQPMLSPDGATVIVFNGEVYNYRELRAELETLGHRFQTKSDTEVVLHAFLEWDRACFSRLRGMFAVGLWRESERRLVLARGRLGIKPLYYYRSGPDLCFGSELKAILEHPEIGRRIDPAGLNCYLAMNYVPAPYTLIEGLEKLLPGHWLEWRDGVVTSGPYWELRIAPQAWTEAAAVEELDRLLRDAVREHLISDVPLGVWLSGGIDSSTIVHYAAEQVSQPLKTFSITFRGRSFDESEYAAEIAARYGTDHQTCDLSPETDLAGVIEQIPYYSDEPSADAGAVPVWFLSRMCREKVTVALSGEGADELFGGYLTYLADDFARPLRRLPAPVLRGALSALRYWPVSDEKISLEYKLKRLLYGALMPPDQAHLYWNGTFCREGRYQLLNTPDCAPIHRLFDDAPASQRYYWYDQRYYLTDDILYKVDRMSMAHSLEVRPPFLDHRIVEFAAALPENFKIRGLQKKYLLRRLMERKLPARILRRSKQGLDIPIHDWFRGPLRELLLDTLSEGQIAATGLFRPGVVERLIRDHLERRLNLGYHLWGLVTLLLWMRTWKVRGAGLGLRAPAAACATIGAD